MSVRESLENLVIPRWLLWVLLGVLVVAAIAVMSRVWPVGADYYYHYRPAVEDWLAGDTRLYDGEGAKFRLMPWAMVLLVPVTLLPLNIGQAALNVLLLGSLIAAIRVFQGHEKSFPLYAVALSLGNLHTFDLLIRGGKLDALILLGIALGWWAVHFRHPLLLSLGFLLIAVKPPNGLLAALLFLYAVRDWSISDQLKALSLPVLAFVISSLLIGFDWPMRYVAFNVGAPPNAYLSADIWRAASLLGLPTWPLGILTAVGVIAWAGLVWRVGLDEWSLSIALATNLVFTPYANDSHFVLLIPAFLFVARQSWKLALLAYLTTFAPLVRLAYGSTAAPVDILYPVVLLAAAWYFSLRTTPRPVHQAATPS